MAEEKLITRYGAISSILCLFTYVAATFSVRENRYYKIPDFPSVEYFTHAALVMAIGGVGAAGITALYYRGIYWRRVLYRWFMRFVGWARRGNNAPQANQRPLPQLPTPTPPSIPMILHRRESYTLANSSNETVYYRRRHSDSARLNMSGTGGAFAASDPASQNNFNPSWMGQTFNATSGVQRRRGGNGGEGEEDRPMAAPIFMRNRYGREDVLALYDGGSVHPPDGLTHCPLYYPEPQPPCVIKPLSDIEKKLRENINSSKAMSLLSSANRHHITSGGQAPDSPQAINRNNSNGWTQVPPREHNKTWGRTTACKSYRGGIRGGAGGERALGTGGTFPSRRGVNRVARGGSTVVNRRIIVKRSRDDSVEDVSSTSVFDDLDSLAPTRKSRKLTLGGSHIKSGFDLWLTDNQERLRGDFVGGDDDFSKYCTQAYRMLSASDRKEWRTKAESS